MAKKPGTAPLSSVNKKKQGKDKERAAKRPQEKIVDLQQPQHVIIEPFFL